MRGKTPWQKIIVLIYIFSGDDFVNCLEETVPTLDVTGEVNLQGRRKKEGNKFYTTGVSLERIGQSAFNVGRCVCSSGPSLPRPRRFSIISM